MSESQWRVGPLLRVGLSLPALATLAASATACGGTVGATPHEDAGVDARHDVARMDVTVGPTACVPEHVIPCACPGGATGEQTCSPNGSGYGACMGCPVDAGHEADAVPPGLACDTGQEACVGDTPETCVAGRWVVAPSACGTPDPVCLHGACVACTPFAMQCTDGMPQTCDENGVWQPQGTCGCLESLCSSACVDPKTDSHNCGACGHDCLGGTCVGGMCQPVMVASQQSAPFALAVDSEFIYWTNKETDGTVLKTPILGGNITTLATGQVQPLHIAVDSNNAYWTTESNGTTDIGTVVRVPLGGGALTTMAFGLNEPDSIVVRNGQAFWTVWNGDEPGAGVIMTEATDASTPQIAASGLTVPTGLALNATTLYWSNQLDPAEDGGTVFAVPVAAKDGGASVTLAAEPDLPLYIAIDTNNVYWTDWTDGAVVAAPLSGGAPVTLAGGRTHPWGITVDATNVYWTDWGDGTVMEVPLVGGAVTTLAQQQVSPLTIAVDAKSVYWASYASGTVMRLAK